MLLPFPLLFYTPRFQSPPGDNNSPRQIAVGDFSRSRRNRVGLHCFQRRRNKISEQEEEEEEEEEGGGGGGEWRYRSTVAIGIGAGITISLAVPANRSVVGPIKVSSAEGTMRQRTAWKRIRRLGVKK